MDMRLLKTANTFVMNYRRVTGEKIALTSLDDLNVAKGYIDKAVATEDKDLLAAAMEIANAMKIPVVSQKAAAASAPGAPAARPVPVVGKITPGDWTAIETAAMKIGGPICGILMSQVRDESPVTFDAAVDAMAEKLGGGYAEEFRREVRSQKR